MNYADIENAVRDLQVKLWLARKKLWPNESLTPRGILDPARAVKLLNVDFQEYEELGVFGFGRSRFEIAGLIDRQEIEFLSQ